jgi:hypothetical protein
MIGGDVFMLTLLFPLRIQKKGMARMMINRREKAVFCGTKNTTSWSRTLTPFLEYAHGMWADV